MDERVDVDKTQLCGCWCRLGREEGSSFGVRSSGTGAGHIVEGKQREEKGRRGRGREEESDSDSWRGSGEGRSGRRQKVSERILI
jgi:hypothetical protein